MKAKNEISKERKKTVETAIEIIKNNLEISQNLLEGRFELYPENRRRSVNKVIYQSQYFQLVYNLNHKSLAIESKGDLIYSPFLMIQEEIIYRKPLLKQSCIRMKQENILKVMKII
ncbi:hypothetical protein QUD57_00335 [Lactococcus lactis]|nr:hypothetical protein [Lactococcus lactis]MDM7657775.1 hypothetical protein [Lactococcus lactis]